jgi:hypothetical protein
MAKRSILRLFRQSLLQLAGLLLVTCSAFAQGTAFTYQGPLTDGGNPADAIYDMQFKLFDTLDVGTGTQQGEDVTNPTVQITNGIFAVALDFGATVFDGSPRFLEISIHPAGSADPYTVLAPRQPLTSSPYSVRTLSAQQADVALDSAKLGGLDASEYVTTSSVGNSFIKNDAAQQTTASFNIDGSGTVGSTLMVNGRAGIGTSPTTGKLQVLGEPDVPGVYSVSPNRGVWGISTGSSYGVYGESILGIGMQGVSTFNVGVVGSSTSATGVVGGSVDGNGVIGQTNAISTQVAGVHGVSTRLGGIAILANGTTGVYAKPVDTFGFGVVGEANISSSVGVKGISTEGKGVLGQSTNSIGVYGISTNGPGVSGEGAQGISGFSAAAFGYGVYGRSTGGGGTGVAGEVTSGGGIAVYASNSGGGLAGRFVGKVHISGSPLYVGPTADGGSGTTDIFNGSVTADNFFERSDRNIESNFSAVDPRAILEKLAAIPIQSWNYKTQPESVRHIGPMAQDFRAAFGFGRDDKTITTIDADGVAMAAIQGLYQMMIEKNIQIERLQDQVRQLERSVKRHAARTVQRRQMERRPRRIK